MPTERELKILLVELQERHPLKDNAPIVLLFGGLGGQASSDIKGKVIVMPRSWLKDADAYFTIIHEYAHFLSEDRVSKAKRTIRHIHNFLAHDKTFKQTETELATEYGIIFKRWIIYPRVIETPWGNPNLYDFTVGEVVLIAFGLNFWGLAIALTVNGLIADIPDNVFSLLLFLALVPGIEAWADRISQDVIRWKYRKHGIRRKA